jgi:hypothetical protein
MARGWESKSVEEQIDAAAARRARPAAVPCTPDEIERRRRIESPTLTRTRVLREMEAASNPRYQELQRKAPADLDSQIAALEKR